jgi:hypothetical protein
MFTPQQAQRIVQQAAATEQGQLNRALGQIGQLLRRPEYQDPEFWPIMQTALATQGAAMIPGGAGLGHAEILAMISQSRNGREAADRIERVGHRSPALPIGAQRALIRVLETARNYQDAVGGLQQVQRQYNIQLSPQTTQQLLAQVNDAARRMAP